MFYANILFLLKLFAQYLYLFILPNNYSIRDLTEVLPQPLLLSCFNGDFLFPTVLLCLPIGILLWERVVPLPYLFVYSVVYLNRDHGGLFYSYSATIILLFKFRLWLWELIQVHRCALLTCASPFIFICLIPSFPFGATGIKHFPKESESLGLSAGMPITVGLALLLVLPGG